jgi:hypothetical protein
MPITCIISRRTRYSTISYRGDRKEVLKMYRNRVLPYYHSGIGYRNGGNQRFFPFFGFWPFLAGGLAGLAVSPFLFNRPNYPPPYYPPYPVYPYQAYGPAQQYGNPYGGGINQGNLPYNITENINVYPR